MRPSHVVLLTLLGWTLPLAVSGLNRPALQIRQDEAVSSESSFPSLTTDSPSASTEAASSGSITVTSDSAASTKGTDSSSSSSATSSAQRSASSGSSIASRSSTLSAAPTATNAAANNGTESTSDDKQDDELPWEPRITPALGVAGVFLIILGSLYTLIGVKSRWVQIFLSTGFLASIATTALVDYVMHPPVKDAVQGGFFVAIFMTGVVFGGGALVFKEFTEGFGCLLGGFSFSMWLLTLKAGGTITNSAGKGVFIGVFCIVAWALSFSSYTRPYALIGSTSFSGATAFVLGVDCFTRAGMKEFWFYIWDLNDDLFPLNTDTFPLTKGMRVEIAVIVIGTIIGIMSQIKLWKVIRTKEKVIEANQEEVERQQEAMEEALGRHLQRQNDREKSQWERQYGDRLQSKRNTVLWQDAHPEKRYSSVSVVAVPPSDVTSPSSENLEMNAFGPRRVSGYGSKNKRQSSIAVDVIEEVEEDPAVVAETERRKALQALEEPEIPDGRQSKDKRIPKPSSAAAGSDYVLLPDETPGESGKSVDPLKQKRRSQHSLSGLSKRLSPSNEAASQSHENLLDAERPYSRASSVAATVDEDNEELDISSLNRGEDESLAPPEIVISPAGSHADSWKIGLDLNTNGTQLTGLPTSVSEVSSDSTALNDGAKSSNASLMETAEKEGAQGNKDLSQSQVSESTTSSADSLTANALAQVPSQMSNVVLSYRTNEWAKHITVAEVPICEEPDTIDGTDEEPPTQLAKPTLEAEKNPEASVSAVEVPPAEMLPPSVKASGAGVGIATNPAAAQRSFSDPDKRRSVSKGPSRSGSMQSLKLPGHRSSRNSFDPGSTTSLVTTPIDENVPTVFDTRKVPSRRASGGPYMQPNRRSSSSSLTASGGPRPYTAHDTFSPYTNYSSITLPKSTRTLSHQPLSLGPIIGTRMDSYDSRQPSRRDTRSDSERRESLLAEWRLSQQKRASNHGISGAAIDNGRAQMRADKENQRLTEEYTRGEQQRKQLAMDQVMRRPDMQDLHREAMRKMQAGANNRLKTPTG